MSTALDILCSLVLEIGVRWGEAATEVQLADARAILDPDAAPYNFITRARGFDKTSGMAGAAVAMLLTLPPGSRLYWLAADVDQGRLALDAIGGYVARTELLRGALDLQASRVVCRSTGSRLDVLPADAPSSWGLLPDLVIVDEFAQWPETPNARGMWQSVSSSALKRPGARMVVITTAGRPSHFAAEILEHARGSDLWRVSETPGPPPWIDPARLAEQRQRLPEAVYRQLFMNEWACYLTTR